MYVSLIRRLFVCLAAIALLWAAPRSPAAQPGTLTIAAAANLRFAMDQLVATYRKTHPAAQVDAVYGASGKLTVQIQQSAPFDLFFAADADFPQKLVASGDAAGEPILYAIGKLVMWSASIDLRGVTVSDLAQPRFAHIAIASPDAAPYGRRAEQALRAAGIWDRVQPRLVFGTDISQAAQFARTRNAEVGFIAESIALDPSMGTGSTVTVPKSMYEPLRQSFVITKRGAENALAQDFARYVLGRDAQAILLRYGFSLPTEDAPRSRSW